ncbi:hypothetical protein BDB00DRAFT_329478 [Zychaea mexicana]|uniref:uncharacterized protein n=1 Tax=Zychaea mexicana TaxID=64656 RepID=UPI0022FE021B|nr:uncharacterized protein BDB00DRAFT_329478 [Zychaea mexicana]KAI9498993.1 hypothetical protein BDB00DRAFT_329478 [Zychaea mexicana]
MSSNNNNHNHNKYNAISLPVPSTYHYQSSETIQRYGSGHDLDVFGIAVDRCSIAKQMIFVRKSFCITTVQFVAMGSLATLLVRIDPIFHWLQRSKYAWWMPLIPTFLVAFILAWQLWMRYFQLSHTGRVSLLFVFSLLIAAIVSDIGSYSGLFGCDVSKLCYVDGILVIFMTIFGLCGVLLYTFQSQYSFSGTKPILVSAVMICISSPWLRRVYDMDPITILLPMLLSLLLCGYLVMELYYIMGNVTVDDFILANISAYIDLLYPMRCLHNLCELTDHVDMFPELLHPGPDH